MSVQDHALGITGVGRPGHTGQCPEERSLQPPTSRSTSPNHARGAEPGHQDASKFSVSPGGADLENLQCGRSS